MSYTNFINLSFLFFIYLLLFYNIIVIVSNYYYTISLKQRANAQSKQKKLLYDSKNWYKVEKGKKVLN